MRTATILSASVLVLLLSAVSLRISAQPVEYRESEEVVMRQRKLNGPRLGVSYVLQRDAFNRDGTLVQRLEEKNIDALIRQFGWHFEWLVAPESGGPAFVTQLLPFIGGVEYSTIIPSVSLVFGIRMPQGFEFGMGPNVLTTFEASSPVNTSLLLAAGYSVRFGDVQIPLNLALLTNRGGNRVSFVFGYAMPERRNTKKFY